MIAFDLKKKAVNLVFILVLMVSASIMLKGLFVEVNKTLDKAIALTDKAQKIENNKEALKTNSKNNRQFKEDFC